MKMLKYIGFAVIMVVFYGCGNDETTAVIQEENIVVGVAKTTEYTLEELKWMEGKWLDSTTFSFRKPSASFLETWEYYPDSLSGKGMSIKQGDTTVMELLSIRIINGKVNYIARPSGEAVIGFPLIDLSDNEATFENLVHDFPQKIKYKRKEDSLKIILSGITPQGERVVTFKMRSTSF